jgi:hypothetical protein
VVHQPVHRRRADPHWQRGLSFVRIGLKWLQQAVVHAGRTLLAWQPIPLRQLEPCIPSFGVQRHQQQPWFTRIELPPLFNALCGAVSVDGLT